MRPTILAVAWVAMVAALGSLWVSWWIPQAPQGAAGTVLWDVMGLLGVLMVPYWVVNRLESLIWPAAPEGL